MTSFAPPRLFASDLDGTLIPGGGIRDEAASGRFRAWHERRPEIRLAYLTGRHLELASAGVDEHGLPAPDYLGCDVGTSLYRRDGVRWRVDEGYRERMRASWQGRGTADVVAALATVRGLTPQPPERQTEFKTSYFVSPAGEVRGLAEAVRERLREAGLEAQVIDSVDPAASVGLIDVLPPAASKKSALDHLRAVLGLSPERVFFSGDSGNDVAALLHGGPATLVGNAPEELRGRLREAARERGPADALYLARGEVADGVLEGLAHFGWD